MDSKILTLLVIGVASIVTIAAIITYQFAQQQYAQYTISENLKNLEIQKENEITDPNANILRNL